jgi:aminopeptidase YwaD
MRQNLPLESSAPVIHRVKTHEEAILFPLGEFSRPIGYPGRPNNRGITVIRTVRLSAGVALLWAIHSSAAWAQLPFLSDTEFSNLRREASGSAPYENLRALTRLHRVPATPEFDQAANFILARAQEYGLQDVHAEQFPIDGKIQYGLMRSHIAWNVEGARLWQIEPQHTLLGDWSTDPIRLADYSHSADVEAPLIDVGSGTSESDYAGKDVRGKIVLADGVLSMVQRLAVAKFGAAGIVSDMPNQSTAWSGLDTSIVRWGHLDGSLAQGFAFMVSRATASDLRAQITAGHPVLLGAHVKAEVGAGHWTVVTGTIPGTDAAAGEIVYSCHLDHQRPGANDNGSGCVTILESARVLAQLIGNGSLKRPQRTLRFIWGPEVEGTMAYLSRHPDIRASMRADIHMDMVGGDLFKNKSVLHVTQTPWSLPTFITDIGAASAETIKDAATLYTEDGSHEDAAVLENRDGAFGTRNAFFVDETPYAEGSDHDDYDSSTIAVPSLYLRDWPDIYIHTDHDTLMQIDPTKLRRVALLGAASGYSFATLDAANAVLVLPYLSARAQQRLAQGFSRALLLTQQPELTPQEALFEARNLLAQLHHREQAGLQSFAVYTHSHPEALASSLEALKAQAATLHGWLVQAAATRGAHDASWVPAWRATPEAARVPRRIGEFGPLTFQNDDVLRDRLGEERLHKVQLLSGGSSRFVNVQDKSALYAYEIVNFVDGKRSVADIRDAVSAEFGPISVGIVGDYLNACEEAKIIVFR